MIVAPFVALDGDDRTGASVGGENLRINRNMISQIKGFLIYTFIYEGAANWRTAKGIVTVKSPGARDIIVNMDEYAPLKTMCAIALIKNRTGNDFLIEKVVRFFNVTETWLKPFTGGFAGFVVVNNFKYLIGGSIMAGKNVDTQALQIAAKALDTYINDVSNKVKKMQDAAVDCKDNMGSDVVSQKAIAKLEVCAKDLSATLKKAEELKGKILLKKKQIEDYGSSF